MKTKSILFLVVILVLIAGALWVVSTQTQDSTEPVFCTSDAKLCPDGSSVGREGPDCEFAECPEVGKEDLLNGIPLSQIEQEIALGSATLLDVRTSEERESGFAEQSFHFDIERMRAGELPDLSKDQSVYVYCRSGGRAGEAKEILERSGFQSVVNIGGFSDWERVGGAVVIP